MMQFYSEFKNLFSHVEPTITDSNQTSDFSKANQGTKYLADT